MTGPSEAMKAAFPPKVRVCKCCGKPVGVDDDQVIIWKTGERLHKECNDDLLASGAYI